MMNWICYALMALLAFFFGYFSSFKKKDDGLTVEVKEDGEVVEGCKCGVEYTGLCVGKEDKEKEGA